MTRKEAINKASTIYDNKEYGKYIVNTLEALGLIKFDKEVEVLFEFKEANCQWTKNYKNIDTKYGTIRLEEWPEGLVLWVGGEIKWKSWEKYYKKGDNVKTQNGYGTII